MFLLKDSGMSKMNLETSGYVDMKLLKQFAAEKLSDTPLREILLLEDDKLDVYSFFAKVWKEAKYKSLADNSSNGECTLMKPFLSAFLILIVVGGFALAGTTRFGLVQAAVEVSGLISTDTTWTKTNSPYTLTGNVLVSNGVTLTIEAGTTVNLNTLYIMVNGTLIARGNTAEQISFQTGQYAGQIIFAESSTGWNEQTGSGSIIDNAFFNRTEITINGGSPKISNNLIERGVVTVEGGSPVISNNNFLPGGVTVNGGSPIILNNNIDGHTSDASGVWTMTTITVNGGSPIISKNTIDDADIGVEIKQGNPYVSDNSISGCDTGILANMGTIERNHITSITRVGNATLKNNTFGYIEVQDSSRPTIIYNNVDSIRLSSSTNVDASYNWWGTTDTAEIDQKIWDYNDDFNLGKVNYTPFLTEANPEAMPDPNAPTPTHTPTPPPTDSPSTSPTPSQELQQTELTTIIGAAIVVAVFGTGLGLLIYLIKRK
jgi:hypothetical protein